jgi:hypothetical protein
MSLAPLNCGASLRRTAKRFHRTAIAFESIPGVKIIYGYDENYSYIDNFAGKPVKDWEPESGIQDPENVCYTLRMSYEYVAVSE